MAVQLYLILCTLILIARPSEILTRGRLDLFEVPPNSAIGSTRKLLMVEQSPKGEQESYLEPGMHSTWLVHDTKSFGTKGETSKQDRTLDFGLTYQEWLAIYFDALGLDKSGYERWAAKKPSLSRHDVVTILSEFDEQIPGYPMLSRIRGPYHDAAFESDEVEHLRQECLRVQAGTSNAVALSGLKKLVSICDRAQELGLSIYLVSN